MFYYYIYIMSNIKILRLNNCAVNPKLIVNTDKSGFSYIIEPDTVNKGRCLVEVISGWSNITQQTLDGNGDITGTALRIVPKNISSLVIRSNILQEGEDTLTGGGGLILGTMNLQNTFPNTTTTTNCASLNQTQSLSFICEKLPSQLVLERLYWSNETGADIPSLQNANNIGVNPPPLIPFEVVLRLTFLEM